MPTDVAALRALLADLAALDAAATSARSAAYATDASTPDEEGDALWDAADKAEHAWAKASFATKKAALDALPALLDERDALRAWAEEAYDCLNHDDASPQWRAKLLDGLVTLLGEGGSDAG